MIRVLFVCLGNICRSPMAEAVFVHKVREAGLDSHIEVDSAGTGNWHIGERPHRGTLQILRENSIAECTRARQLHLGDLDDFDYVVAMDNSNFQNIEAITLRPWNHRAKLSLLLDHATGDWPSEVPDPYFTGEFQEVYRMVCDGCDGLLELIRTEHGLKK